MSLKATELAAVVAELRPWLSGARLERITACGERGLLLGFRGRGKNHHLRIALERGRQRLHLVSRRPAGRGARPPAWVMKLRAELLGRRLVELRAEPGGRRVVLEFSGSADAGRLLVADLFGNGRLWLCTDQGDILAAPFGGRIGERLELPSTGATVEQAETAGRFGPVATETLAVNTAVENFYDREEARERFKQRRHRLAALVNRHWRREQRLVEKLRAEYAQGRMAAELRHQAEVLKANLGRLRRGWQRVELDDFLRPGTKITVELDATLEPSANMQRLFERARRLERKRLLASQRLEQVEKRSEQLRRLSSEIAGAGDEDTLERLTRQCAELGLCEQSAGAPRPRRQQRRQPYRRFVSASGLAILVGRSARDNLRLTFGLGRGNDLWLHARGWPGAHVLVRLPRGTEIDEQTLLDAATLAAVYSGAREPTEMEVAYTRVKNLRPIKGSPGQVSMSREKTIRIRVELQRLNRLRASQRDS